MDPFVQAAKRFSARCAMSDKLGCTPLLRIVAPPSLVPDLVQILRFLEAQPECRRPLVVIEDPFTGGPAYFAAVTDKLLEAFRALQAAARDAGTPLPDVAPVLSTEPVVTAVETAERIAAALPPTLDGLTVALVPAQITAPSDWPAQVAALATTTAALSTTGPDGRSRRVHWRVHDAGSGPLASVLGNGVELDLDEDALFAWWKDSASRPRPKAPAPRSGATLPGDAGAPTGRGAELRARLADGVEALRGGEHDEAISSFRAAQALCASAALAEEEAAVLLAIGGAQLVARAPAAAAASYRSAADLARTHGSLSLACQAKLGEAGAELLQKRRRAATSAYAEAAELAQACGSEALRVEALRMAGESKAPPQPPTAGPTPEIPTAASDPENTGPAGGATQPVPIAMPRRVVPFVKGLVDLDALDEWIAAGASDSAEDAARQDGDVLQRTEELRDPLEAEPALPFGPEVGGKGEPPNLTQAVPAGPPGRAIPFVEGGVDPKVFQK